jgi:UDPglucose 6-dehydrogenase
LKNSTASFAQSFFKKIFSSNFVAFLIPLFLKSVPWRFENVNKKRAIMRYTLFVIMFMLIPSSRSIQTDISHENDHLFIQQKKQLRLNNKKIIAVIGTGYVGLVTGAGLAEFGNLVICADINREKIAALNNGIIPIYEPGLDQLVERNVHLKRLTFTHDVDSALSIADIIFITVDTPMKDDGTADLQAVMSVAQSIARNSTKYQVIVTKSTVPIGTGIMIKKALIKAGLSHYQFDIVSNPEFLREGSAVKDFLQPDRIVIGSESISALSIICSIYETLIQNNVPCVFTNLASAEMTKYASNAFLAVKVSFINEIANLCDKMGANVDTVASAMGLDHRINPLFLKPGPGFGGSCFPKDTQALLLIGQKQLVALNTVNAALETNKKQFLIPIEKTLHLMDIQHKTDCLANKKIAVLGAAFKANTDDVRYSPACTVMKHLIKLGATVSCYDPVAMHNASRELPSVDFCNNPYQAIKDADAVIIMTEWDEFRQLDWESIGQEVKQKIVVDARNIIKPEILKLLGFKIDMIGLSYLCRKNLEKMVSAYKIIKI